MRQQVFDFIENSGDDGPGHHAGRDDAGWGHASRDGAGRDEVVRLMSECIGAVAQATCREGNAPAEHETGPTAGSRETDNG